jgi:hypothetical protein
MDQMRKDHRGMFARMWVQLRHRTAFFTTPPEMWLFLIVLGLFTSFSMCVTALVPPLVFVLSLHACFLDRFAVLPSIPSCCVSRR